MTYSSAIFNKPGQTLEDAQEEKYKSLCESIKLKTTDHVLEIGCGWGGFAIYAAQNYKCKVTTVTVSQEQFVYVKKKIESMHLQSYIQVELKDYRLISGEFDKVVSIEMIEAVGAKFLTTYFGKIQSVLKKDGILAIQAIVCPDSRFNQLKRNVDFIQKHIFPGSLLPSIAEINNSINKTGDLFLFSLKDLGKSYVQTLQTWQYKFNENIDQVEKMGFDDVFIRKWNYYFSYCEAAFEMRNINVVQMVYARPNNLKI